MLFKDELHKNHGVSNYRQLECVINSFLGKLQKYISELLVLCPLWGSPLVTNRSVMWNQYPRYDESWWNVFSTQHCSMATNVLVSFMVCWKMPSAAGSFSMLIRQYRRNHRRGSEPGQWSQPVKNTFTLPQEVPSPATYLYCWKLKNKYMPRSLLIW